MDMRVAADASGSEGEPWTLPEGWCWTEIGNIARLRGEKVNPSDAPQLPFVGMDDIPNDGLRVLNTKPFAQMKSAGNRFEPGDVLYGRLRPYLNKTAIASMEGAASGELLAIITAINASYFQLFLHSRGFINRAMATVSGDRPRIDFSTISEFKFPLAPLPEQRRIVERIHALFAEIADGEAALEAARKGLETFRRALLKAAVTGELTRDWRETHKPAETGHDLLARIRAERASTPAKGRGKSAAASPPLDTSDLPDLPEGWAWARVSEVGVVQLGRQRSPEHHQGENMHRYLRVANVFEDRIDLGDVKEMNFTPSELETFELRRNDILLNEGQTPDLLGRPAMWRSDERGICFQNTLLRFRATEPMEPEFCLLVFRYYLHSKRFKQESQITTNIAHLSSGRFSVIEFPVPPIAEQREIVRLTLAALDSTVEAKLLFEQQAAEATRLRQSILKSAFEGTLVPQDPADEPASVMLERLKLAAPKVNSKRRGRGKAGDGG